MAFVFKIESPKKTISKKYGTHIRLTSAHIRKRK